MARQRSIGDGHVLVKHTTSRLDERAIAMNTSLTARIARFGLVATTAIFPVIAHVAPAAAAPLDHPAEARYVLPFDTLAGNPDMSAGDGLGYWLWQDDHGLHLRTT